MLVAAFSFRRSLAAVALTALAAGGLSAAPAQAEASPAAPAAADGLLIGGSSSQTLDEMILASVDVSDAATLDKALSVLAALEATTKRGEDPGLPGRPRSIAESKAEIKQAQKTLEGRKYGDDDITVQTVPTFYEQRGSRINDNFSWQFTLVLEASLCGIRCTVTDRITQRWTIDPGASVDRFSFSSIYSPYSGNYNNVYAVADVYCSNLGASRAAGDLCGSRIFPDETDIRDGSGSGVFSVDHSDQSGKQLVEGVEVQGTFEPTNKRVYDNAGTGIAVCRTGDDDSCLYK